MVSWEPPNSLLPSKMAIQASSAAKLQTRQMSSLEKQEEQVFVTNSVLYFPFPVSLFS